MEMAANASLGRPLALVGAKLTTCLTETFAAVPQKRPRTSEKGALVKPIETRLVCAKVVKTRFTSARAFFANTMMRSPRASASKSWNRKISRPKLFIPHSGQDG
jgi:hypothetical protein